MRQRNESVARFDRQVHDKAAKRGAHFDRGRIKYEQPGGSPVLAEARKKRGTD